MKYQIPICECGGTLDYEREVTCNKVSRINKNGTVSKRTISKPWQSNGLDYLICDSCIKRYQIDYDDHDRIVRGELAF